MFEARHAPYAISSEVEALLVRHYSEPHRAYHDTTHITELLRWFDIVADEVGWKSPRDVYDAILFHDVIYEPSARDNETRSADLAVARGCSQRTAELIALTALHGKLAREEVDDDAALFLDCDMAILGAEPAVFDAYDRGIAAEYRGHVPGWLFKVNRRRFLKGLLARERIFLSDFFHQRYDASARNNLRRAITTKR